MPVQDDSCFREIGEEPLKWRPTLFDRTQATEATLMDFLLDSARVWRVHDTITQQLQDLVKTRAPREKLSEDNVAVRVHELLAGVSTYDYGRWIYYPWSGRLVHVLPPDEFRELRLDRNRHKITSAEQERLSHFTVGIVGLSVGNAVALTLALEGACGHLKLADFDQLTLSNMNRLRAGVHELDELKTVLAARQIYEINPYASVSLYHEGITANTLDDFFLGEPKLDVLIDECDDLRLKFLLRERARALHIPVLMETSDRGMVDVERFDQEPERPIFHGLVGNMSSANIGHTLSDDDKTRLVLAIAGVETVSTRMAAALLEVKHSISTWPQLASDVTLGGASTTTAVRRLALGQFLPSGRRYVDLETILAETALSVDSRQSSPAFLQQDPHCTVDNRIPEFVRFIVEHGALAPSGGNCQPWRFYFDGDLLWVIHDQQRSKNLLDVGHRASYVALGAAIENMVIAATYRGYQANVTPFPVANDGSVVAVLSFNRTNVPLLKEGESLLALVRQRVTNRKVSQHTSLSDQERATLSNAATTYGARLHLLTSEEELAKIGRIVGQGDRIRFLNPSLRAEMMAEVRWTPEDVRRTKNGIGFDALELTEAQRAGVQLLARADVATILRDLGGGEALEDMSYKAIRASSAVGVLTVDEDDPSDVLRGGQAVERLWLTATRLGLSLQPVGTLIYMFAMLETDARAVFSERERLTLQTLQRQFTQLFPQWGESTLLLLFRLSLASPPTDRSLRLPLDQVLFWGNPQANRLPEGGADVVGIDNE